MFSWLYAKLGLRYLVVLYGLTRLFAVVAGGLCILYVNWTLDLRGANRQAFTWTAWGAILFAVVTTMLLSLVLTRKLRTFLWDQRAGQRSSRRLAHEAAQEAVLFAGRIAVGEACLDPWITILPICLSLYCFDVPALVQLQVCVAGFLGLACIIMATFLWSELGLQVVIRELLQQGVVNIDFERLPQSRLGRRLEIGFGTTILVTAVMIGGLALQSTADVWRQPEFAAQAVSLLRRQTVIISVIAVCVGLCYARLLSNSVTNRIQHMLHAMRAVERGDLQQRLLPTGTDEIDRLARQFNLMVEHLSQGDRALRELNASLEQKIEKRTLQLQVSLKQLQELDQLKTQFFSNISHELRTPLLLILSPLSQLRQEHARGRALSNDLLEVAEINARRLLIQINQLLEFSRIESGSVQLKLADVDVNRLVELLVVAARPFAQHRGLQLDWNPDSGRPRIAADPEKLETVLRNLISNAIKFTPGGGTVRLRTLPSRDLATAGVRIEVSDTGPGISPEERPRLFRRFSQLDGSTSRTFAGSGLGLALVKELTERHGGKVDVLSTPGTGSTFVVEFPVGPLDQVGAEVAIDSPSDILFKSPFADLARPADSDPEPTRLESVAGVERPLVLVVDDNVEVRRLLKGLLARDYQVAEAENGQAGCSIARLLMPDLILSDVMMPQMNGYEFCRAMKGDSRTAVIPFVLITARARSEMKVEGLDVGADEYLCKPFEAEELHARLRSLLRLRKLHQRTEQQNDELRQALAERELMQKQLVQSEKLASLGQLVAGLAHEVNNAINPVCSGAVVLRTRLEKLQQSQSFVNLGATSSELELLRKTLQLTEIISNSAQRTAQIVEDMKRFAHPGASGPVAFDLQKTLDTTINLIRLQYRQVQRVGSTKTSSPSATGIQIRCHYEHKTTGVGPFGQLDQVFLNLLGNAVQALGESGRIDVATQESNVSWRVSVRDNGPGIPEALRERIMDPFFTTKPPGQGTGLGLSICHGLITGIGGTLTCYSEVGVGTEFVVEIPRETRTCASNTLPSVEQSLHSCA